MLLHNTLSRTAQKHTICDRHTSGLRVVGSAFTAVIFYNLQLSHFAWVIAGMFRQVIVAQSNRDKSDAFLNDDHPPAHAPLTACMKGSARPVGFRSVANNVTDDSFFRSVCIRPRTVKLSTQISMPRARSCRMHGEHGRDSFLIS